MTLLCMDEYFAPPYELIPRIEGAMAEISARPIFITLDRSVVFGAEKHLVLTNGTANPELRSFVLMLRDTLSRHNLPRDTRKSFKPHVTIIYGCGQIEPLAVGKPYAWTATEFQLVYSHHGESRHEEFGRWRFDPDAPPFPSTPEQLRFLI